MRGPSIFLNWVPGMLSPYVSVKMESSTCWKVSARNFQLTMAWSRHLAAALLSFLVLERTSFMVRSFETCAGCMERKINHYSNYSPIWDMKKNMTRPVNAPDHSAKKKTSCVRTDNWSPCSLVCIHAFAMWISIPSLDRKTPAWPKMYKTTGTKNLTTNLLTYNHIYTLHNLQKSIRIRSLHQNQIKSNQIFITYFSITFYNIL